jgi:8-oxo-dGTP diphosphatase
MTRSHHSREDGAMALLVVAAAIRRNGRVLAARRVRPVAGWEFPGGKVEAGESEPAALIREIHEELDTAIEVGARLGEAGDGRITLVLYDATLTGAEPRAMHAHDALQWVAAAALDALDWLPIDRELLPRLRLD